MAESKTNGHHACQHHFLARNQLSTAWTRGWLRIVQHLPKTPLKTATSLRLLMVSVLLRGRKHPPRNAAT